MLWERALVGVVVTLHVAVIGCCGCFACGHNGATMAYVHCQAIAESAAAALVASASWQCGDAPVFLARERRTRCLGWGTICKEQINQKLGAFFVSMRKLDKEPINKYLPNTGFPCTC